MSSVDLYFVKLGGSAFTYKNDNQKNAKFREILGTYVKETMLPTSRASMGDRVELLKQLQDQIRLMIRSEVVLSFARTLARWGSSSGDQHRNDRAFIVILGGGSPAHGTVKTLRDLQLQNRIQGVLVRLVVGYMSSLVVSLLAQRIPVNYIPSSAWFYWEMENDGQVVDVRKNPSLMSLHEHLLVGIHPVLGGDVILGKTGWSILSGDPIPYFLHRDYFQPSAASVSQFFPSLEVKETIMVSDIGVNGRPAGLYDLDPSDPSAQLITRILVEDHQCVFERESGTSFHRSLRSIGGSQESRSEGGNGTVDVTGGMLQKIWWQVKLAREGIATRILDYQLLDDYVDGKQVPHTHIIPSRGKESVND